MNNYLIFLKKELSESLKTYKFMMIIMIFLIVGILSPLSAKFLPEILSSVIPELSNIILPQPTSLDSWQQFFKNITQLGLVALILIFHNTLHQEISKGTLINLLSKGLPRSTVIWAKYTLLIFMWTLSFLAAVALTLYYNYYLFPSQSLTHLPFALFNLWLFGCYWLSLILLGSLFSKKSNNPLLFLAIILLFLFILNLFPDLHRFTPLYLSSESLNLLTGELSPHQCYQSLISTCSLILINLMISQQLFKYTRI